MPGASGDLACGPSVEAKDDAEPDEEAVPEAKATATNEELESDANFSKEAQEGRPAAKAEAQEGRAPAPGAPKAFQGTAERAMGAPRGS